MAKPTKKPTSGSPSPKRHLYTFWGTRDSDPDTGALSPFVKVWLARPAWRRDGAGTVWDTSASVFDLYCEVDLVTFTKMARTVPDDDRQCIRVEGDSVRSPGDAVDGMS